MRTHYQPVRLFGPQPPAAFRGNGCGPAFFGWLVPDFNGSLTAAGNRHDYLYSLGGGFWDRLVADCLLLINIVVSIRARWPLWARWTVGLAVPWLYFAAVRIGGAPVFYAEQGLRRLPTWWHRLFYKRRISDGL